MLAIALLLAVALAQDYGLAPGQEGLWASHVDGFPKAAWVAGEDLPVSNSPQLGGRLLAVLQVGTMLQVAGVVEPLAQPTKPVALEEVMAIPVSSDNRQPGYVQARGLAVFETLLGHPGPDVRVFASVVGQSLRQEEGGLVLELAVWRQRAEEVPELIVIGPNLSPGLRAWESPAGGLAVGLAGGVVVLDAQGCETWRSPDGEPWRLSGPADGGFRVVGPEGERCISTLARE